MSQNFNPAVPGYQSALNSGEVRDNFNALDSCHAGETEPANPVEGRWWFKPSNKTFYAYSDNQYRPVFTIGTEGLQITDPRFLEMFYQLAPTTTGEQTVVTRDAEGRIETVTETIAGGLERLTTLVYNARGDVETVTTAIASISYSVTETLYYDSNGDFERSEVA